MADARARWRLWLLPALVACAVGVAHGQGAEGARPTGSQKPPTRAPARVPFDQTRAPARVPFDQTRAPARVPLAQTRAPARVPLAQTRAPARVPFDRRVRSLEVIEDGAAIVTAPAHGAARRGTLSAGARIAVEDNARGTGCGDGRYYRIGEAAFVCASDVRESQDAPDSATLPQDAMPNEHLSVVSEGAKVYALPQDVSTDEYESAYAKGFTIVATGRERHEGQALVRTRRGYYMHARDLRPVRASPFHGIELGDRTLAQVGFVVAERAPVRSVDGQLMHELPRLSHVQVARREGAALRLVGGGDIAPDAVVQPAPRPPPEGIGVDEPWLDIDLSRQLLVAYRGARPVFATLISSGKPRPATRTPRGQFRIWVKLLSSDMRDREQPELEQSYALEAVPWVQYFEGSYGLHAAFWHERFGQPMSRGCINLSPADARYLFEFTRPTLPAGWEAVLPVERGRGTLVVVR